MSEYLFILGMTSTFAGGHALGLYTATKLNKWLLFASVEVVLGMIMIIINR